MKERVSCALAESKFSLCLSRSLIASLPDSHQQQQWRQQQQQQEQQRQDFHINSGTTRKQPVGRRVATRKNYAKASIA